MKNIFFAAALLCGTLSAQSSFRIFDSQMNDVTGGVLYLADTNSGMIQLNLTVENIDTVSRNTTAGRLIISQPPGSTDAFIWGMIQYLPNTDSSQAPEIIAPAGTAPFEAYYFSNNNAGTATVNYCFWERTNMNNTSCVTVTFENHTPAGVPTPLAPPQLSYYPNPAPHEIGVGWTGWEYTTVNLYSATGALIETKDVRGQTECAFIVTGLPSGLYVISCIDDFGRVTNSRFVH
jgi:hypothetical protein